MSAGNGSRRRWAAVALVGSFAIGSPAVYAAAHSATTSAGLAPSGASAVATATAGTPPAGTPPAGRPPSGRPPPGGAPGGSSQKQLGTASYTLKGGTATKIHQTYTASDTDQSAILVTNGGALTLTNSTIKTTGKSSSSDSSSFYGLNAGILAYTSGKVTISGSSITTSGDGANGVFAYGSAASASIANSSITATGQYAHGAMASGGGSVTLSKTKISTAGASSAAIATDRGGGSIKATGGIMLTSGFQAPGIYSTGAITVSGATVTATGSEAAVVEGSNSIVVTHSKLKGARNAGVMIYQSMSGDAQGGRGTFSMSGGSLSAAAIPLFYVTNSTGVITLKGVQVTATSGTLVKAGADRWGTTGKNGGTVIFSATGETLAGNIVADRYSAITLTLQRGTILKGAINTARTAGTIALTLDRTSKWVVTANSTLSSLIGATIAGSTMSNIVGNGHTVTYDKSLATNKWLGGKTYTLAGGGRLVAA